MKTTLKDRFNPFIILLIVAVTANLSGCAWVKTHQPQIAATTTILAAQVERIALNTILAAATSEADSQFKANYLDSLSTGFRSQMGTLITADEVKQLVQTWAPDDGQQWLTLSAQLASIYATANPQTPAAAQQILEAFAQGVQAAAVKGEPAAASGGV